MLWSASLGSALMVAQISGLSSIVQLPDALEAARALRVEVHWPIERRVHEQVTKGSPGPYTGVKAIT